MIGTEPVGTQIVRDNSTEVELTGMTAVQQEALTGMTAVQQEIYAALEDTGGGLTHVNDRPDGPGLMFWDVALGVVGILSLLVGVVLVFFFAALGSIVLVLGGLVCAVAFQGAAQVPEPDPARTATRRQPIP